MMADKPESIGRLQPLCSLNLPVNALVGYNDAQHRRKLTDNPFAADSLAAREWSDGYQLWWKEFLMWVSHE